MTRNERPANSRKNTKYASIFDFAEAAENGEEWEEEEYALTRAQLTSSPDHHEHQWKGRNE